MGWLERLDAEHCNGKVSTLSTNPGEDMKSKKHGRKRPRLNRRDLQECRRQERGVKDDYGGHSGGSRKQKVGMKDAWLKGYREKKIAL